MIEATRIEAAATLVRQARGTVHETLGQLARGLNGEEHALHMAGSVGLASNDIAMVLDGPVPLSLYEAGRGALNALRAASNEIYRAPQAADQPAGQAAAELRKADFWLGELDRYIAGDRLPDARVTSQGTRLRPAPPSVPAQAASISVHAPAFADGALPTIQLSDVRIAVPGRQNTFIRAHLYAMDQEFSGERLEKLDAARKMAQMYSSAVRNGSAHAVFTHPDGGYSVQQARLHPDIFAPGKPLGKAGLDAQILTNLRLGRFDDLVFDGVTPGSPLQALYWNGKELFLR